MIADTLLLVMVSEGAFLLLPHPDSVFFFIKISMMLKSSKIGFHFPLKDQESQDKMLLPRERQLSQKNCIVLEARSFSKKETGAVSKR